MRQIRYERVTCAGGMSAARVLSGGVHVGHSEWSEERRPQAVVFSDARPKCSNRGSIGSLLSPLTVRRSCRKDTRRAAQRSAEKSHSYEATLTGRAASPVRNASEAI